MIRNHSTAAVSMMWIAASPVLFTTMHFIFGNGSLVSYCFGIIRTLYPPKNLASRTLCPMTSMRYVQHWTRLLHFVCCWWSWFMMEVVEIWESWLLAAGIACSAFSESYLYLRFCVVQCASLCWTASKLLMRLILLHLETNKEHCYSTSLTLWLWQLLSGSVWQWFGVHLQDWPGSCLLCWLKSPRIIISKTYGRINITLYSFYGGLVRWFFRNSMCVFFCTLFTSMMITLTD